MVPANRVTRPSIGILTGVTAAGKTELAIRLCEEARDRLGLAIEIINADSLLVYRGFDVGTAKPSHEEQARIPHHLIDCVDATQEFTAGDFVRMTQATTQRLTEAGKRVLIVGGTGFYLKALLFGLWETGKADPHLRKTLEEKSTEALYQELLGVDPEADGHVMPTDRYRVIRALEIRLTSGKGTAAFDRDKEGAHPDPRFDLWFIDRDKPELTRRVAARTRQMLAEGLVEETARLTSAFGSDARPFGSVGYLQTTRFLKGETPPGRRVSPGLSGLTQEIELATLQLVKKQQKWFQSQLQSRGAGRRYLLDDELPQLTHRFFEVYSA